MRAPTLVLATAVALITTVTASPLVRRQDSTTYESRPLLELCSDDLTAGPTGTPGSYGGGCSTGGDCSSALCCTQTEGGANGQCVLWGEFHKCSGDAACSSDYCYNGSCASNFGAIVDLDDGEHCKVESNCKNTCDTSSGVCTSGGGGGGGGGEPTPPSCSDDGDCSSTNGQAFCFNGSCVPGGLADGAVCSVSRQCSSGTCSQGGYCRQQSSGGGSSGGGGSGGGSSGGGGSGGGSSGGGSSNSGSGDTQDDTVTTTDSSGVTITADGTTETATATVVSADSGSGAGTFAPTTMGNIVGAVLAVVVTTLASLQLLL